MGLFSFFKDAGKKILGNGNDDEAIKKEIEDSFGGEVPIDGLVVSVEDGVVTLAGVAKDNATREKAILIAGNIEGVEAVNADQLVSPEIIEASTPASEAPTSEFYTIQEGDTLWAIAQKYYGDGNKYQHIVDENLEVIKDADKIYPGQTIRIPDIA